MRVVGRAESSDFIYWTRALEVMKGPREAQPYSMPVIRYAGIYLGLPAILRGNEDRTHTELAWSPDTITWHPIDKGTPLIANAAVKGNYDWGTIYASYPIIRDDEIRVYYGAGNAQHFDWRDGSLCLATLRPDGFAGYEPLDPAAAATVITTPMEVSGELNISADIADDGHLTVSVLDASGQRLLQRTLTEGTLTDDRVEWPDEKMLQNLVGREVTLEFRFISAKLYAFEL